MRIIAALNQKGGVAKTTTCVNLAAALARKRQRTLLIDLDPQAAASKTLGFRMGIEPLTRDTPTVYDALKWAAGITAKSRRWDIPVKLHLHIIPATIQLAAAELELVGATGREKLLRAVIEDQYLEDKFDYILIDCPPSLGILTVNAMSAADELIIPMEPEPYAMEGMGELLRQYQQVQSKVNPKVRILGILFTKVVERQSLHRQTMDAIGKAFSSHRLKTIIPKNIALAEVPVAVGKPASIFDYDDTSVGAKAYRSLAAEIMKRRAVP